MKIKEVILNDYRVYKGENRISFDLSSPFKNITLISGKNGFGKTTFLSSLVWCLYGQLMAEVDEIFYKEIRQSGGYKNYCQRLINRKTKEEIENRITKGSESNGGERSSFSVSIEFQEISLPSSQANSVVVSRSHNILNGKEIVEILIDGKKNELSKEVGPEIFINDFILPREIARFFFFDSEKIVEFTQLDTLESKRKMGKAYSEILGIKKYTDLKNNLENLKTRLRSKSVKKADKNRLAELTKNAEKLSKLNQYNKDKIDRISEELVLRKKESDDLQEKLIREGSGITIEELKSLKEKKALLTLKNKELKGRVGELTDLAPFALAIDLMDKVKEQLDKELIDEEASTINLFTNEKLPLLFDDLKKIKSQENIHDTTYNRIKEAITKSFSTEKKERVKPFTGFDKEQRIVFNSVYSQLKGDYRKRLELISSDFKFNQNELNKIIQKLSKAESKENDVVVSNLREDKTTLDNLIKEREGELIQLKAQLLASTNELAVIRKEISELHKNVEVQDRQKKKDETATRIINNLDTFIENLKNIKKGNLEKAVLNGLSILMHKSELVKRIEVLTKGDLLEFKLLDQNDKEIPKESLSKGEQQLLAMSILKGLIEESGLKFPVFIDSPLQKLDKVHAQNVITNYYPKISEQVVLLPLMEKEFSLDELNSIESLLSSIYLIENIEESSTFLSTNYQFYMEKLFTV